MFYAYVNIQDPLVAWEAAIGRYCSADALERDNVFSLSLRQFALFRRYASLGTATPQIRSEIRLETLRAKRYLQLPSRLRGVFVFDDLDAATAAAKRWDGDHFDKSFLSEIEMVPDNCVQLDSEWITYNLATDNDPVWMESYWRGETYGTTPLTEVICSGVGAILNLELRERAYRRIMELFPKSVPILSIASVGFHLGFNGVAQIVPYLLRDGSKVRGVHLLNMNDLANESPIFPALSQYKEPWPPLVEPWNGTMQIPDLRDSWFELEQTELYALATTTSLSDTLDKSVYEHIQQIHTRRH